MMVWMCGVVTSRALISVGCLAEVLFSSFSVVLIVFEKLEMLNF